MLPEPTAIGHGMLYLLPAAIITYLGLWLPTISRLPRLTVMGLAIFIVVDRLRFAIYWFALAFGEDISAATDSTEMIYIANLGLVFFLIFAWHERRQGTPRKEIVVKEEL